MSVDFLVMHTQPTPVRAIGIAASAGGVEALRTVVSELPANLAAAVCVVLHIPATGRSLLAPILDRDSPLRVVLAEHGSPLEPGTVYVAPADHHLLVGGSAIELSRGPKENGVRPAADPMFRSLARSWGAAAIGVTLSGALDDGAAGMAALKEAGGIVIVQDPSDALVPGMPGAALEATSPDHVVRAAAIGPLLARLVDAAGQMERPEEPMVAEPDSPAFGEPERPGGPASGFTCPECSGALWELRDGALVRYQCRVGHSYSEDAMVEAQGQAVEAALWTALEVLEERSELLTRMADRMTGTPRSARRFRESAREVEDRASLIRRALSMGVGNRALSIEDEAAEASA
jgi:two-component system chemotaxis response regulator CheB